MKVGFISRRTLETFLNRVEGVSIDQSVIGRILGFGTVCIIGVGGTKNFFPYINHPLEFRNNSQASLDAISSAK